ncbi:MAG: hypothetical protein GKR90_05095 [Pseudomonadales bacterium]|nr:hypothetical protein [Pseudomonadales bacterium]
MATTKTLAIVTLAIGQEFSEMGRVTHPLMRKYAKRIGAEFIIIDQSKNIAEFPTYEKFQMYDLLERYRRVIFLDTDILVLPDAPSLFDLVPPDTFGAANEEAYSMVSAHKEATQAKLGGINWVNPYFNSGVMVVSQNQKELFNPKSSQFNLWVTSTGKSEHVMSDQPYLNYRLNELAMPMTDLGFRYNHTRVIRETHIRFNSFFIHYSGPSGHRYGSRLTQMRKDLGIINSPIHLLLSRKFTHLRWLLDRADRDFLIYLKSRRDNG